MKPLRSMPDDVTFARLLEHQKYCREEKIPALERLLDVLKESLAASGVEAAPWLLNEYSRVCCQIEETQQVIREIEARANDLGQTLERFDYWGGGTEYGDPT